MQCKYPLGSIFKLGHLTKYISVKHLETKFARAESVPILALSNLKFKYMFKLKIFVIRMTVFKANSHSRLTNHILFY